MPTRQFVTATFRGKGRAYTYHNDLEPLAPDDWAKAPDPRNPDSWQRVQIVDVNLAQPPYETKGLLGKVEDEKPAEPTPAPAPAADDPPRCPHGMLLPWQCDDCDRESSMPEGYDPLAKDPFS